MEAYTRAAYISSTRKLNGSVVCKAADGLPFLLEVGQTAHFVPPALTGPRQARVEQVDALREGEWEVHFSEIDDIEAAERIAGCFCLVADDQLTLPDPQDEPLMLVGFRVVDASFGELGIIERVMATPAQTTLAVTGAHGEVLIPLVDEFVVGIDAAAQTVSTQIPAGLVGLNARGQEG